MGKRKKLMNKIHWSLPAGMLLTLLAITIRRAGLEIGDFSSGFLSGITIAFILYGIVQLGRYGTVTKKES
ncbi:hypothetical protein D3C73_1145280 [compost metagenome]